jgi:transglutaminase-like putative cysteine protease
MTQRYASRTEIPEGNAGILGVTLPRIVALIERPSAAVELHARSLMQDAAAHDRASRGSSDYRLVLASLTFAWVRHYMAYQPELEETIQAADLLLEDIRRHGQALGDCDDQVILLGALYHAEGLPIELVFISQREDREAEHVYLRVDVGERWIAADPIVRDRPFGWELPAEEVTASYRVRV